MNKFPKLHNAMWPGLVGKGPGSEPFIDLDTMLDLTASAENGNARFEGVDLFLSDPHISIDSTDEQLRKASRIAKTLRELGIRAYGIVRIDSATDPGTWANDPEGSKKIASTFRECCNHRKGSWRTFGCRGRDLLGWYA